MLVGVLSYFLKISDSEYSKTEEDYDQIYLIFSK